MIVETKHGKIECNLKEYTELLSSGMLKGSVSKTDKKEDTIKQQEINKEPLRDYLNEVTEFLEKNSDKYYTGRELKKELNLPMGFMQSPILTIDDRIIIRKTMNTHLFMFNKHNTKGSIDSRLTKNVLPLTKAKYYKKVDPAWSDTKKAKKIRTKYNCNPYQLTRGKVQKKLASMVKVKVTPYILGQINTVANGYIKPFQADIKSMKLTPDEAYTLIEPNIKQFTPVLKENAVVKKDKVIHQKVSEIPVYPNIYGVNNSVAKMNLIAHTQSMIADKSFRLTYNDAHGMFGFGDAEYLAFLNSFMLKRKYIAKYFNIKDRFRYHKPMGSLNAKEMYLFYDKV